MHCWHNAEPLPWANRLESVECACTIVCVTKRAFTDARVNLTKSRSSVHFKFLECFLSTRFSICNCNGDKECNLLSCVTLVERPAKSVGMIISLFIIMAHKLYECVELSMFWKAAQETECRTNATFHGRTGNEFFFLFCFRWHFGMHSDKPHQKLNITTFHVGGLNATTMKLIAVIVNALLPFLVFVPCAGKMRCLP